MRNRREDSDFVFGKPGEVDVGVGCACSKCSLRLKLWEAVGFGDGLLVEVDVVDFGGMTDGGLVFDEEMGERVDVVGSMQDDSLYYFVAWRVKGRHSLGADDVHFQHFVRLVGPRQ